MDVEGAAGRIARLRKLAGWSQHQLASRAFVSTSLIKKVEQGRTPPSPSLIASCARALAVPPSTMYGLDVEELVFDENSSEAAVDALRSALHAYDDPEIADSSWSDEQLRTSLHRAGRLRRSFRYERLSQHLPQLLHQLHARCRDTTPATAAGERVRAMLHDAYRLAATLGGRFATPDIAAVSSERHVGIAPHTGDPLRVALSSYHRCTHLLQHGQFARGLKLLDRAHTVIQHDETPAKHAMTIQLHLRSAVLSARAGDGTRADEHIAEARALADRHDPPAAPYDNVDASRLNIDIHWCAMPVENGDGTTSVSRAAQVSVVDRSRPERVGHHHIDMARAWLLHGNRENALRELDNARRTAPRHARHHPTVHETVRALARTDRRVTDSLADFARWTGIRL